MTIEHNGRRYVVPQEIIFAQAQDFWGVLYKLPPELAERVWPKEEEENIPVWELLTTLSHAGLLVEVLAVALIPEGEEYSSERARSSEYILEVSRIPWDAALSALTAFFNTMAGSLAPSRSSSTRPRAKTRKTRTSGG